PAGGVGISQHHQNAPKSGISYPDHGHRRLCGPSRGGWAPISHFPRGPSYPGHFFVFHPSLGLSVFLHLFLRGISPDSLRPADEFWVEVHGPDRHWRFDSYCRRGGSLMNPVATPFFFYGLSAIAVASAIAVIMRKNPVHSAIALIFTLLSLAGLYLML